MLDKLFDLIRPAEPDPDSPLMMIVGLGNPGKQYQDNRHNVGFQCLDLLAERHGLRFDVKKGNASVALGTVRLVVASGPEQAAVGTAGVEPDAAQMTPDGDSARPAAFRVVLAKPQTFMNVSGRSVAALLRFYKVEIGNMLVIYDDLDLPVGRIRLRPSGGAGGHNGIKSIIGELGSNQFPRLRVGIDRPPGRMDPADYVLQDFSAAQEAIMAEVRPMAVTTVERWLAEGIEPAMNEFNAWVVE